MQRQEEGPQFEAGRTAVDREARRPDATAVAEVQARAARCVAIQERLLARVALQDAVDDQLNRAAADFAEAVARYSHILKTAGAPPERVLVSLKEALNKTLPRSQPETHELLALAVKSAVEAYYNNSPAGTSPRPVVRLVLRRQL
jgi:hypothetical protein